MTENLISGSILARLAKIKVSDFFFFRNFYFH